MLGTGRRTLRAPSYHIFNTQPRWDCFGRDGPLAWSRNRTLLIFFLERVNGHNSMSIIINNLMTHDFFFSTKHILQVQCNAYRSSNTTNLKIIIPLDQHLCDIEDMKPKHLHIHKSQVSFVLCCFLFHHSNVLWITMFKRCDVAPHAIKHSVLALNTQSAIMKSIWRCNWQFTLSIKVICVLVAESNKHKNVELHKVNISVNRMMCRITPDVSDAFIFIQ